MAKRYLELVRRHLDAVPSGAAGSASLPSRVSSFAETMGAYRFFNNDRIDFVELMEPLRQLARQKLAGVSAPVVLLIHDLCKLSYPGHASTKDQAQLAQANNRGYELTTVLAVSGRDVAPLAPVEVHFKTGDGVLSTRDPAPPDIHQMEQVLPTMNVSGAWNLGCPALHVIDREADSVGHYRAWHAGGHHFLVRGHDHRVVTWEGKPIARNTVGLELQKRGPFQHCGEALYRGRAAQLWVAETEVVLAQPARTMVTVGQGKKAKKKQREIPGPPLTLRLFVAQVRNETGQTLAKRKRKRNAVFSIWAAAFKVP